MPCRIVRTVLLTMLVSSLIPVGAAGAATRSQKDIRYRTVDGVRLRLDVYYPTGADGAPVVMLIHGGGWHKGDEDEWQREATRLAGAGFVAVAANYRLACDGSSGRCGYHLMAPVRDLRKAIVWTRNHASEYGGDGRKVGVLGSSAGGHLAQMLGTTGRAGAGKADVVVSWSGPSKLRLFLGSSMEKTVRQYVGCSFKRCRSKWSKGSPITRVTGNDSPALIVNSRNERVPVEGAEAMADKLSDKGVRNRLKILRGSRHGREYARDVWDDSLSFLESVLGS